MASGVFVYRLIGEKMKKLGFKKVLGLGLGVAISFGGSSAFANEPVTKADGTIKQQLSAVKVTDVYQWSNGSVFVYFDGDEFSQCNSGVGKIRVGFEDSDPHADFFKAQALTALSTGKTAFIIAETNPGGECPVHGNTMRLETFGVKN